MARRRTRVVDGVEYEVVWDGRRGSASLSRSRGDSPLAESARSTDTAQRLGRHESTLEQARRELAALWGEDVDEDEGTQ